MSALNAAWNASLVRTSTFIFSLSAAGVALGAAQGGIRRTFLRSLPTRSRSYLPMLVAVVFRAWSAVCHHRWLRMVASGRPSERDPEDSRLGTGAEGQ